MQTFTQTQRQIQKTAFSHPAGSRILRPRLDLREHSILQLQRTIGNHAVQRMLQTQSQERKTALIGTASRLDGHELSRIPTHSPGARVIQTKLAVNPLGDEYEREADHVAEQVMCMHEPHLQGAPKQQGAEHRPLQMKRVGGNDLGSTEAPPVVHEVLHSPGQPLDTATRAFMEPRFGHDFSHVRVHTDAKADESARAVEASAYTVGNQIAFGASRYAPESSEGRKLLAHELSHTIQQASAKGAGLMRQAPAQPAKEEDSNLKELKTKVGQLVKDHFGGDRRKAFDHYDANHDGGVDAEEIKQLLKDADVGNFATRGAWADGILKRLDTNKDGKIQWSEFESGIK
jgi:hypothetical protein